jgi:hypothetical protein
VAVKWRPFLADGGALVRVYVRAEGAEGSESAETQRTKMESTSEVEHGMDQKPPPVQRRRPPRLPRSVVHGDDANEENEEGEVEEEKRSFTSFTAEGATTMLSGAVVFSPKVDGRFARAKWIGSTPCIVA